MRYVDGFVIPVPKKNLKKYATIAAKAGAIWMEHGALEYRECVLEDATVHCGMPFPKLAQAKRGETVVFAWIVYKSKAHRNRVNAMVMKDPRLTEMPEAQKMPFNVQCMAYGGFEALVDLQ